MERVLSGLKPEGFFRWFEEITRIPHGSCHEEALSAFLENFAAERGLACVRDEMGNVLIRLPASAGYENEPPVLLQGHMDMVLAGDGTSAVDQLTDPLELVTDGNRLRAKGTTLGADDGAAVAAMLALADDPSIPHPELELLCTVQEEIALVGIQHVDYSLIRSRRMINLDAGTSHQICVSSTGAKTFAFEKDCPCSGGEDLTQLCLRLSGGLGGHAGILAHKNRACCINVMGELLYYLSREMPVCLAEITADGPSIHGSCETYASVPAGREAEAESLLRELFPGIRSRYEKTDPGLTFEVLLPEGRKSVLSAEDSERIIRTMFLIHTGVRKSDADDLNIIITSVTYSKIFLKEGQFRATCAIRSLDDSVKELWYRRLEELLGMLDFRTAVLSEYSGWPGGGASVMQNRFIREHRRLFGAGIGILHLHASIEVNIVMKHIPDMDAVGIQPTGSDYHTPDETLYIDQVQPFWDLLLAVLALKDGEEQE